MGISTATIKATDIHLLPGKTEGQVGLIPKGAQSNANRPAILTVRENSGFPHVLQTYAPIRTKETFAGVEYHYIQVHFVFAGPVQQTAVAMQLNVMQDGAEGFEVFNPAGFSLHDNESVKSDS